MLRHLLHQEILADQSVMSLGGNESTPLHDVVLQKFNEDYGELVDIASSTVFRYVEKDVLVKLTQTDEYTAGVTAVIVALYVSKCRDISRLRRDLNRD